MERRRGEMSGEVYASKELWASYRCSFTSPYDALCQDANLLPLLDQLREFGTNSPGILLNLTRESKKVCNLLKLIVQVTWDGHFLNSVDSFPRGFFFKVNWRIFAPLFERTLREECGKYPIIPNYRVVDYVVEEPSQPSPVAIVINSISIVSSKWFPTSVARGNAHRLQTR